MKIRVMQSDTMIKMMDTMGGIGTAMAQGDVYSAIQAAPSTAPKTISSPTPTCCSTRSPPTTP